MSNRLRNFPGSISGSICRLLLVGGLLNLVPSAWGDDQGRGNQQMIQLIRPVAKSIHGSVVQVLSAGRPVALGTVVADGYVLTKRSELSGDPIRVRLSDNRMFPARVAAVRRTNDLALLHVDSDGVDSDGRWTPVKFDNHVPAIASFLLTPDRRGQPIGFGVVGTRPRAIADEGMLGVKLADDPEGRAVVDGVEPRSGAELAGLRSGDLIVKINGRDEHGHYRVRETLQAMFPGENVQLTILRPSATEGVETLELEAQIMEYALITESVSDVRVNGPRNARLSGFDSVIQHDTVLGPDECGGPVLDSSGRVVGINIARAGRVVSYAIPSSLINAELPAMLSEAGQVK
jgi:S1-C subfamily serine protease